jgi:hypothetical protein
MRSITGAATTLGLAALCALAPGVAAQAPGGPILQQQGPRWLPTLGVRGGFDYRNSAPTVGATVRLPIPIAVGGPAITPGADFVFQDGLTERQAMVDFTVNLFGIDVGGGPAWMNSVFGDDLSDPRETRLGWTARAGIRSGAGPFGATIEFRWLVVDEIDPRYIMIGLTWTPGAPRRRGFGG